MENIRYLKAFVVFATLSVLLGGYGVGYLQSAILVLINGQAEVSSYASDMATNVIGFMLSITVSFFVFRWVIRRFILTQVQQANGCSV